MFKTGIVFSVALLALACSTAPPPAPSPQKPPPLGSIERVDPAFDQLVPKDAQLEKVAGGFTFIEGPLWRPSGALWFSDVAGNVVRQWFRTEA
jgi:gluconolactonase